MTDELDYSNEKTHPFNLNNINQAKDSLFQIIQTKSENISRSIRIAISKEEGVHTKHLQYLANVGSVSPYIGLFGTVIGIVNAFQGLSDATQATINAVAPGISEALIATALGLFAAIPAVLAFNKFTVSTEVQIKSLSVFGEELVSIFSYSK